MRTTRALCQSYGHDYRKMVESTRALALFELLHFASAPTVMRSDVWLSIGCDFPIEWIGTAPMRPLSVDVLQSLLDSILRERIINCCIRFGFALPIVISPTRLRASGLTTDAENTTLRLVSTASGVQVVAFPQQSIAPLCTPVMMV